MGETLLEWVRKNRPSDLSVRESTKLNTRRPERTNVKNKRPY